MLDAPLALAGVDWKPGWKDVVDPSEWDGTEPGESADTLLCDFVVVVVVVVPLVVVVVRLVVVVVLTATWCSPASHVC